MRDPLMSDNPIDLHGRLQWQLHFIFRDKISSSFKALDFCSIGAMFEPQQEHLLFSLIFCGFPQYFRILPLTGPGLLTSISFTILPLCAVEPGTFSGSLNKAWIIKRNCNLPRFSRLRPVWGAFWMFACRMEVKFHDTYIHLFRGYVQAFELS
jgi:hypothetical protein